jgi:hypothetical protein
MGHAKFKLREHRAEPSRPMIEGKVKSLENLDLITPALRKRDGASGSECPITNCEPLRDSKRELGRKLPSKT